MAVIKQVYRSADTFRFPAWDEAVSYPVNSVITVYDSELDGFRLYIAAQDTNPGHPPSIGDSDWNLMTYDSDTNLALIKSVWDDNIGDIINVIQPWFDSEMDSEINKIKADVDSEIKSFKEYFDSEIGLFKLDVDSDYNSLYYKVYNQDSDIAAFIDFYSKGRIYPEITTSRDIYTQRLTGFTPVNSKRVNASFFDPNAGDVLTTLETTVALQYENGLHRNEFGDHVTLDNYDSETITQNFASSVYISEIAFRGAIGEDYNDYFLSGKATFNYSDATFAIVDNPLAVVDNATEVIIVNPNPDKTVDSIVLTAYNPSGRNPGVNFIRVNSVYNRSRYETENASFSVITDAAELVQFKPHPDVIFVTKNTNAMWVSVDSEWVTVHPNYKYITNTIQELKDLFPASLESAGTRAYVYGTSYDYYVTPDNLWVLDEASVPGFDSERFRNLDSELNLMTAAYLRLDSDVSQVLVDYSPRTLTELRDSVDSDYLKLTRALNTFYVDYIKLKQEHNVYSLNFDSDWSIVQNNYKALLLHFDSELRTLKSNNDSDIGAISQKVTESISIALNTTSGDHDSDISVLTFQVMEAFTDISLLRNGEVVNNESDIRVLELYQLVQDSEIDYLQEHSLRYRGLIDHTISGPIYKLAPGEAYVTKFSGIADSDWGLLTGEYISGASLLLFRDSEWTVVSGGSSNENNEGGGFPAGTIQTYTHMSAIPSSFKLCDGAYFDPGIYSELYTILKTNRLPDLRGYFLRAWSDSDTIDPTGPRTGLSIQQDDIRSHNHSYTDVRPNNPDGVLNGSTDDAVDGSITANSTTGSTGGAETRPKNVAVYYAIAMYSGAGAAQSTDSDLRSKVSEFDSDLKSIRVWKDELDSDHKELNSYIDSEVAYFKERYNERESDIAVLTTQVINLDSDVSKLTLYSQFAQNSSIRKITTEGTIIANAADDMSAYVFGTATYEPFSYPDTKFFYATAGAPGSTDLTTHPTKRGRELNGNFGTPSVSTFVIHDAVGGTQLWIQPDSEILYDIQIVSTFRTT